MNIYEEHIKKEAFNLFWRFYRDVVADEEKAKECALISLKFYKNCDYRFKPMHGGWICGISYFEDIEKEIKKLIPKIEIKIIDSENNINYNKNEGKTFI